MRKTSRGIQSEQVVQSLEHPGWLAKKTAIFFILYFSMKREEMSSTHTCCYSLSMVLAPAKKKNKPNLCWPFVGQIFLSSKGFEWEVAARFHTLATEAVIGSCLIERLVDLASA